MKKVLKLALLALLLSTSAPAFCGDGSDNLADAISNGASTSTVAELIRRGADVNKADKRGVTPLMAAAARGQLETIKLLLQKGANPNAVVSDGKFSLSAYDVAVVTGHDDASKLLPIIGPDGKLLAGAAREQRLAQLDAARQDYLVKSKLAMVVSSIDPLKVALAMYYQEQGFFPVKKESLDPASAGSPLSDGSILGPLGFTVYPQFPSQVASVTYVPLNVNREGGASSFGIIIKLGNIRPDTIDGLLLGLSPSDDMVITGPGSASSRSGSIGDGTAIVTHFSCHQPGEHRADPIFTRFFGMPGAPLVCK
jgi:hypothetical protein